MEMVNSFFTTLSPLSLIGFAPFAFPSVSADSNRS
ncbi:MAG: hypothetical protein JWL81_2487 [Verrucomicrobiales bacterium]|nr:hypothetical protein [Verrucomicrobiales bacterium]